MTKIQAKETVLFIREVCGRPKISDRKALDLILQRIETLQCSCGRWARGGDRQGSALCPKCYVADLPY
jgi:hypothetical protein